jgi:hypothetical protein
VARKVIFATANQGYEEDQRSVGADEYVDIDMSISLDPIRSEEEATLVFSKSTYAVWARPRGAFLSPHGHILGEADRAWLERTPREYGEQFLCRVNQTDVVDQATGSSGFLVEVTSGIDSRQLTRAENYEQWLKFGKEHRWKVGLVAAITFWWVYIR